MIIIAIKRYGRKYVIGCIKICRVADMEMTCDMQVFSCTLSMAIWVAEFSSGGAKLERFLHKN